MMLLLVATLPALTITSCGDDEKDEPELPTPTIVNGIDLSLLPGYYAFDGNIAPGFSLYHDGTCETYSTGLSTTDEDGTWIYDKDAKILILQMRRGGSHTYTVKSLTETSITMEWSSVKYGNYTASWERVEIAKDIDTELIPGRYESRSGNNYPSQFVIYPKYSLSIGSEGECEVITYQSKEPCYGTYTFDKRFNKLNIHVTYTSAGNRTNSLYYDFTINSLSNKEITMEETDKAPATWNRSVLFEEVKESLIPGKYYQNDNIMYILEKSGSCTAYEYNSWGTQIASNNGKWTYDKESRRLKITSYGKYSDYTTDYDIRSLTETELITGSLTGPKITGSFERKNLDN